MHWGDIFEERDFVGFPQITSHRKLPTSRLTVYTKKEIALISLSLIKYFIDTVNISAEPDTGIHQAVLHVKSLSLPPATSPKTPFGNLDRRGYPG